MAQLAAVATAALCTGCASGAPADDVVPAMRADAGALGQQIVKAGSTMPWVVHESGSTVPGSCARAGQSRRALLASAVVPARGVAVEAVPGVLAVLETRGYDEVWRSQPTGTGPAVVQLVRDRDRQTEIVFTVTVQPIGDRWYYSVLGETACLDG